MSKKKFLSILDKAIRVPSKRKTSHSDGYSGKPSHPGKAGDAHNL